MRDKVQFTPPWWLRNNHVQSCFPYFFRPKSMAVLRWEEVKLPDGDFLDLAWAGPSHAPLILLLHGLEGSVFSHYIQAMLDLLVENGYQVVTMHLRGCSGRLNRKAKTYHGGDNGDLGCVMDIISKRFPKQQISAVGFSLGGNVLLQYLAKQCAPQIKNIVSVSTPFDLKKCAKRTDGFYLWNMLRSMKRKVFEKISKGISMPISEEEINNIKTLDQFDELLTIPLNNFYNEKEYYQEVSSRYVLHKIKKPTLLLHALDDPLVPEECIPKQSELSKSINLEVSAQGGHIGFIHGDVPWRPMYWLGERVLSFLKNNK